MFKWLKAKFKKQRKVVAKFKVRVHGNEIVEVVVTGKTPENTAALANRFKASLSIMHNGKHYETMPKDIEKVFDEATKVFEQADKMFTKL